MARQVSRVGVLFSLSLFLRLTNLYNRHWHEPADFPSFANAQLSRPHTAIQVARRGYDGDIRGYRESIIQDANLSASNSTSFSRPFGATRDFVRGNAVQYPFAPGGLEAEVVDEEIEEINIDLDFLQDGKNMLYWKDARYSVY